MIDSQGKMNKQRKVVITITYNEMGIIIDTKAEEVTQPNLQPTCTQLATDCISRQDVLGWLLAYHTKSFDLKGRYYPHEVIGWLVADISKNLFADMEGEQDEHS